MTLIDTHQAPYGILLLSRHNRQLVISMLVSGLSGEVKHTTFSATEKMWFEMTGKVMELEKMRTTSGPTIK